MDQDDKTLFLLAAFRCAGLPSAFHAVFNPERGDNLLSDVRKIDNFFRRIAPQLKPRNVCIYRPRRTLQLKDGNAASGIYPIAVDIKRNASAFNSEIAIP